MTSNTKILHGSGGAPGIAQGSAFRLVSNNGAAYQTELEINGPAALAHFAVAQEAVQLVVWEHRPVLSPGLEAAPAPLWAARRIGVGAQLRVGFLAQPRSSAIG